MFDGEKASQFSAAREVIKYPGRVSTKIFAGPRLNERFDQLWSIRHVIYQDDGFPVWNRRLMQVRAAPRVSDPSRLEIQPLKLLPQAWTPEGAFTHFPPMVASWDFTALKQTHGRWKKFLFLPRWKELWTVWVTPQCDAWKQPSLFC